MDETYDVVVIGGGAAGLSGALALGRARRSVAVVDDGTPRNAPAHEMHNYLGRDGTPPAELRSAGRAEVAGYGVALVDDRVTAVGGSAGSFTVETAGGRVLGARRLLVTTGLVDELPDVPGVRELWGTDVLHCPYCHGWEVRDQPIGVLATGPMAVHQALLWRQLSGDVVLFRHGAVLSGEEAEQLAARGVTVLEGPVATLETDGGRLSGVRLADGEVVPRAAVVVTPRFTARSAVLAGLGLEAVPFEMGPHVVGSRIPADPRGATAVPGVWVAGNVADPGAQVIGAAAAGLMAGAQINADLVAEETWAAVEVVRAQADPEFGEAWWEERYRSHGSGAWSGRVNDVLAAEAAELPPGRALDAGAGEGGDAVWLARRGWEVTALDLSRTALDRAAAAARSAGVRIETRHADVTAWEPGEERWDLVTASFLHLLPDRRDDVLRRLAAAVAPGGTLLVTAHDGGDCSRGVQRPGLPGWYATGEQMAAVLDPADWAVEAAETRPRDARGHEHGSVHVADTVLRARRRQSSSSRV
ncbi:thioredoxin reductase [Geodermatophilus bullaregiensis]|uniref:FAD-dependent oxidoreductase n=1 Tax=Geodermatophilus bullaregiensis TaxID=1564160 RepID=UPI001959AC9A|nr:FAD-dependent oxidoreductase [Geodermatophilus bullaregiensis]MBM7805143.1 thioredoxin reductase [Geodermatophilus bullaregiensis]